MTLEGYLTTKELAARWKIAPKTLMNWRCANKGPRTKKVGWLVFYAIADVERYEKANTKRGAVFQVLP